MKNQTNYFNGYFHKARAYPFVLPYSYIKKLFRRGTSSWGDLLTSIEYWILKRILK